MKFFRKSGCAVVSLLAMSALSAFADPITIKVDQPGSKMAPMLYGLMTEEINYSYDGGLYAELIQNRIFRNPVAIASTGRGGRGRGAPAADPATVPATVPAPAVGPPSPIPHWTAVTKGSAKAAIATDTSDPINATALTTSLKLDITAVGGGERAGVSNDGFWGIPVKPNTTYKASFYAKSGAGFSGPLTVDIESTDGATMYASGRVESVGGTWKKYNLNLTTGPAVTPTNAARFVISGASPGSVWFNLVSLFPPTYKDRPNGNRPDIMQLLADMHPSFLRFPGGNYVEGQALADRFNWKNTIGPLEERAGHRGTWGPGGQPQYRSSDGMGLLEFCQWCEDINMEPLLAVWAGYTLDRQSVPAEDYPKYAQEALEEIEYVMGDASTVWGARRAKDGHPAPFKLHYIEVGNEDPNGTYDARFTVFFNAIKAKYPDLKVIATRTTQTTQPDIIDEHHYMNIQQAQMYARQYAADARKSPKVFLGEWATRVGAPTPQQSAAVADAAFLTGLERNPDVIIMSCYAPLFVNVNPAYPMYAGGPNYPNGMQWPTDLIGYDAGTAFGSPSYYVQAMFSANHGDVVLPYDLAASDIFASCARDNASGEVIAKLVNLRNAEAPMEITLQGVTSVDKNAMAWVLAGAPGDMNSVAEPKKVSPKQIMIDNAAAKFTYTMPANSVVVMRIKVK